MINNVNHKNMIVMWHFLKGYAEESALKEDDVNIFEMLNLPFPEQYRNALSYYTDPTQWSPLEIYVQCYLKTKEVTGDPNAFRNCGRSAAKYKSFANWRQIAQSVSGPMAAINVLPLVIPDWNDTKIFEIVEPPRFDIRSKQIKATIKYTFHSHIDPCDDYCSDPHILGLLEAIPTNYPRHIYKPWETLPLGNVSQSLVQYDPVKLFSGIFFKHLDLKPFFDGNLLYITNPDTGHVELIGRKVILVPSDLHGIQVHLGNYRDITGTVHDDEITGTLISETINVRGEPVCEAGIIMEAPYFIINYSFEELAITRKLLNLRSMFIGRNELLQQYFKVNDSLRVEIEEKNKAYEKVKEYANNLEERVEKRTNQYREQKDKAESLVLSLQEAYKNLQETQNKLVMQEVAKAQREKELQTEKAMSGGLAHEGRNALMPAAIQIRRLMEYREKQSAFDILSSKSGSLLNHIIKIENEYGLPQESINKEIIPIFREINDLIKDINQTTEEISTGVGKGLGLIDLFRTYSKTQEMTRGAQTIDVLKIANDLGETYKKRLSETGVAYTVTVIDTEPIITGDYLHIESIVKNLFLNALDALEKVEVNQINLTISRQIKDETSYLRITVADTGEGIPADQCEKIFNAFYTTKSAKGTGLGLSIVKRLVEIYEGSIDFESQVGRGTAFTIDLKC